MNKMNFNRSIKEFILVTLRHFIKNRFNFLKKPRMLKIQESTAKNEERLLSNISRYQNSVVSFLNKKIEIVDNASYFFIKNEIFNLQIYKFNCASDEPYIIDCGANIGLSIIYFKQLFPNAEIIAFEPDDRVFKVLQNNIETFEFNNVLLIKKACWDTETTLKFYSEGADAGRVARDFDNQNIIKVATTSLKSYLNKKVDFLKIDIEGAENVVLPDIQDMLANVDRIFVEYHSFLGKEQMLPEILTILKKAGFRLTIHHIGVHSANPFIAISHYNKMDMQLNIYGYRS